MRAGIGVVLPAFLAAAMTVAAVGRADNTFTIAVVSDIQNYTDYFATLPNAVGVVENQMRYIVDHRADMNIAFTTFVGDIVQHGDGTNGVNPVYGGPAEYNRAASAISLLAASGMPFGMAAGNHDYDNHDYASGGPLAGSTMWNSNFGSSSSFFAGKSWYGGASDSLAVNPGLSSYQTFTAGDRKFLHLALEMEAGDSALAWAQSVLDANPGVPTIVTTHSYLSPPSNLDNKAPLATVAPRNLAGDLVNSPGGWNNAQGIWDKFISKNNQVFMVLCGHMWGSPVNGASKSENIRIDDNDFGNPVYQILTDYQANTVGADGVAGSAPGGAGWMRFMEFNLTDNTIHFSTYSTLLDKWAGQNGETTFRQHPDFSDFTLPLPAQAVPEPSTLAFLCVGGLLIGTWWGARLRRCRLVLQYVSQQ